MKNDEKYYPENIVLAWKTNVYKNRTYKEIDYKLYTYGEFKVKNIIPNCCDSIKDPLPSIINISDFTEKCKSIQKEEKIIPCFNDSIRSRFIKSLKND